MSMLKALRARLRGLVFRRDGDAELAEEIRFHIEQEAAANERRGMSPAEARRRALAHFGGVQNVREEHRDVRRARWIEDFAGDVRFAFRALRRTPGLAIAAIVTLAVGIGANVAIFSAVNAVVLQPLPFADPQRLVMLSEDNPEKNWVRNFVAPANYLDWRARVDAFSDVAAYSSFNSTGALVGFGEPRLLEMARVTGNYFSTLGVRPILGRTLTDEETWASGSRSAVLSHRTWRDAFASDSSIVGRTISVGGRPFQVVGVMSPDFAFPSESVDLWTSLAFDRGNVANAEFRRAHWLRVIARLKPGVTVARADAQFQTVVRQLQVEYPETNRVMGADIVPLHEFLVGDTRLPLLVLLGSVALLLLIACANVGSLLLVQAAGRERESAVRLAIGAGSGRLVRQSIAEGLVLSSIGGVFGLALGWAGTHVLERMQPPEMLRVHHFAMDASVLAYVTLISCASGVLFSIAPALRLRGRDPAEALRSGTTRGGTASKRARRWGDMLVVGEVALALLLTVGAGLVAQSFWRLRQVNGGFDANGVLVAKVALSQRYDSLSSVVGFWNRVMDRSRALPGVTAAAHASSLPLLGYSYTSDFTAEGRSADGYGVEVAHRSVSRDYFRALRVPIIRGRAFTEQDRPGSEPVVIINERLAKQYFPNEDPIGKRVTFDRVATPQSQWRRIVGVAGDERQASLSAAPQIEFLHPIDQQPWGADFVVLRTAGDPAALAPLLRGVVRDIDPSLVVQAARPMRQIRDASLARARFLTTLLFAFAVVGLTLSIVGVYGMLAQLARNRTREMGIRLALGAPRSGVRWLVVRHGLAITATGLAIGAVVSLVSTRAMTALLFETPPNDPLTLAAVALLLTLTSVVASWVPARRASLADPAAALREG
jgi:putative ABC transport system permease protein